MALMNTYWHNEKCDRHRPSAVVANGCSLMILAQIMPHKIRICQFQAGLRGSLAVAILRRSKGKLKCFTTLMTFRDKHPQTRNQNWQRLTIELTEQYRLMQKAKSSGASGLPSMPHGNWIAWLVHWLVLSARWHLGSTRFLSTKGVQQIEEHWILQRRKKSSNISHYI